MKNKVVEYRGNFHEQWCDSHIARYITSKEEFINAIWTSVECLDLSPIGMGSWNQEGAKEWFFNGGYSSYLTSGSIKDFRGEDWYIFEYEKGRNDDTIFIIKLETIKKRYSSFIHQFT